MERVRASSSARDDRKLNRDSHPVFQFDNVTSKSDLFSDCVIGSMQTWCQRLGGNVTTWCWLQSIAFESFKAQMAVTRVKSAGGKTARHMLVTWSWQAGSQCLPGW